MMTMDSQERAWALGRAQQVAIATILNLRQLVDAEGAVCPCAVPTGGSVGGSRGGTFVVVGAGPSLERTVGRLAELREAGAAIATVNTALPALLRAGVVPDVVVAREVAGVAEHLEGLGPRTLRVVDLGAAPDVLARSIASGPTAWFVSATLTGFELASRLGVRPLYGGSSALTAAVALADAWGAARVVLLGVDLAIAPDGSTYAPGTAYAGQSATPVGATGDVVLGGEGFESRTRVHVAGGIPHPARRVETVELTAYGGVGKVRAQQTWVDQVDWLSERATRDPALLCVDATGAGASKTGWYERSVDEVIASMREERETAPDADHDARVAMVEVPAGCVGSALAWVEGQVVAAREMSATILDPRGCVAAVRDLAEMDLVYLAAAPGMLRATESPGSLPQRLSRVYAALSKAADAVESALRVE